MRVTSKGQVTIPKDVRDSAGIKPGSDVAVVFEEGVIKVLRKARTAKSTDQQDYARWLKRVRGTATAGISTEEILNATRGRGNGNNPS